MPLPTQRMDGSLARSPSKGQGAEGSRGGHRKLGTDAMDLLRACEDYTAAAMPAGQTPPSLRASRTTESSLGSASAFSCDGDAASETTDADVDCVPPVPVPTAEGGDCSSSTLSLALEETPPGLKRRITVSAGVYPERKQVTLAERRDFDALLSDPLSRPLSVQTSLSFSPRRKSVPSKAQSILFGGSKHVKGIGKLVRQRIEASAGLLFSAVPRSRCGLGHASAFAACGGSDGIVTAVALTAACALHCPLVVFVAGVFRQCSDTFSQLDRLGITEAEYLRFKNESPKAYMRLGIHVKAQTRSPTLARAAALSKSSSRSSPRTPPRELYHLPGRHSRTPTVDSKDQHNPDFGL